MAVSSRTRKLRETTECSKCRQLARRVAKLEKQLAAVLQRIDKLEMTVFRPTGSPAASCGLRAEPPGEK